MNEAFHVFPVGAIRKEGGGAFIEVHPDFGEGLLGLDGHSHIYFLCWFHESDTVEKRATLRVHPRNDKANPLTGVFATRSPRRPNPLALYLSRVHSIQGNRIEIDAVDARDGTPVVDIKPYISGIDSIPEARGPAWVRASAGSSGQDRKESTASFAPGGGARRPGSGKMPEKDCCGMKCPVFAGVRRKVPFHDVDMMRVVWHGHYLKYFDEARRALFVRQGVGFSDEKGAQGWVFPVIRSEVKHLHPLRLDEEFLCTAALREAKVKIVLDFEVVRIEDGKVCARGRSEQAAVKVPDMEMAFRIPEGVQKALWGQNGAALPDPCDAGGTDLEKQETAEK